MLLNAIREAGSEGITKTELNQSPAGRKIRADERVRIITDLKASELVVEVLDAKDDRVSQAGNKKQTTRFFALGVPSG